SKELLQVVVTGANKPWGIQLLRLAWVDSSEDDQSLGEDASKQGRKIHDIDADEDITLVNDQDDAVMFNVSDLQGEEVFVEKELADKEKMVDRAFKKVNTFVDLRTELIEGSLKRGGEELTQGSSYKQKVDDDKEIEELKELMEIIPDLEEVAIDAIPLAVKSPKIIDWKIHKEGNKSYYQIIRAGGNSKMYMKIKYGRSNMDTEFWNESSMRSGLQFFRAQYAWCLISNGKWQFFSISVFIGYGTESLNDMITGRKDGSSRNTYSKLSGRGLSSRSVGDSDLEFSSAVIARNSSNLKKIYSSRRVPSMEWRIFLPSSRRAIDIKYHSFSPNSRMELFLFNSNNGVISVKKRSSQDEGNFAVFFHFENNEINRKGFRVSRESFAYKEYGIRLMLAPRSAKSLQEKVLLKLHGIRKLPGSLSFGGTLFWIIAELSSLMKAAEIYLILCLLLMSSLRNFS
nr:hypothetical protein [Tanacetum cinerariifolium]